MKKLIYIFCFCIIYTNAFSQYYYYYYDEKVPLTLNTAYMYISSETDINQLSSALGNDFEITSWGKDNIQSKIDHISSQYKKISIPLIRAEVKVKVPLNETEYLSTIEKLRSLKEVSYVAPCFSSQKGKQIEISHLFSVKLRSTQDTELLQQMAIQTKSHLVGQSAYQPLWYILSCDKNAVGNSLDLANEFYESGNFVTAEPEFFRCMRQTSSSCDNTDPIFPNQWNLQNTGQVSPFSGNPGTSGIDINACQAWSITTGSPAIITAVIDNGFQLDHPDFIQSNGVSNVANNGFDEAGGTSPSIVHTGGQNENDHATKVAGIIAAAQNSIGISGVAPTSSIMSVSLDFNNITDLDLKTAIEWAWNNGASIINFSIVDDGDISSSPLGDGINDALTMGRGGLGTVVVCAAGNQDEQVEFPASLCVPGPNSNRVPISVGGIDRCGAQAGTASTVSNACDPWPAGSQPGSDFGTNLAVVAPASNINTCVLTGDGIIGSPYNQNYTNAAGGTSFAAPHVAGIAALLLSVDPCLTVDQVTTIIESTCTEVDQSVASYTNVSGRPNGNWSSLHGYGLVNAFAALTMLTTANVLFLQNITETTTVTRANLGNIFAGSDVNSSLPQGPYTISNSANVEIKSTTSITLQPGFVTNPGGVMLAHIEPFNGNCSQWPSTDLFKEAGYRPEPSIEDQNATETTVNINPNPFANDIHIDFSIAQNQCPVDISITDMTGRVVYQSNAVYNIGSQEQNVTVNSSASMYIAKVCIGSNCTTQKLVKYASY